LPNDETADGKIETLGVERRIGRPVESRPALGLHFRVCAFALRLGDAERREKNCQGYSPAARFSLASCRQPKRSLFFFFFFLRASSSTRPRPRPPPGPPVRRAAAAGDDGRGGIEPGFRSALAEILPQSRRAELRSRWSRAVNAGSSTARCGAAHLAGTRFCL